MRNKILSNVLKILKDEDFEVSDCSKIHSSFDIFTKKGEFIILIKVLWDIESLNAKNSEELKKVADLVCGVPLVVGYEMKNSRLKEGAIYSRYNINIIAPKTFEVMIRENEFPIMYSIRGNYCMRINPDTLVSLRKKLQYSQREFANEIGVSKQSIYRYESQGKISVDVVERIFEQFGKDAKDLLLKPDKNKTLQSLQNSRITQYYHEQQELYVNSDGEKITKKVVSTNLKREPEEKENNEKFSKLKKIAITDLEEMGFKISITRAPFDLVALETPGEKEKIFTLVSNDPSGLKKKAKIIRKISTMLNSHKVCISEKDEDISIVVLKPKDLENMSDVKELIDLLSDEDED